MYSHLSTQFRGGVGKRAHRHYGNDMCVTVPHHLVFCWPNLASLLTALTLGLLGNYRSALALKVSVVERSKTQCISCIIPAI